MNYASSSDLVISLLTGIGGQVYIIFSLILTVFGSLLLLGWAISKVLKYLANDSTEKIQLRNGYFMRPPGYYNDKSPEDYWR